MTEASRLGTLANLLTDGTLETTHLPDGTAVMLDARKSRVVTLSDTAAFIIAQLASEPLIGQQTLTERICARFQVDPDTASNDLDDFVDDLLSRLDDILYQDAGA